MEYLVPVLIIVVIGAVVAGGTWLLSRRSRAGSGTAAGAAGRRGGRGPLAGRVSSESARTASSRLDQATHREVYRLIAAGRTGDAVLAYRRSTGLGTFEAMLDIQALATYPQMWVAPGARPGAGAPQPGTPQAPPAPGGPVTGHDRTRSRQDPTPVRPDDRETAPEDTPRAEGAPEAGASDAPSSGEPGEPPTPPAPSDPETTNLVIPQDWLTERLPADRPFELEVVRDETTVRVSSSDLPPFLRDQLTAMVRDGRVEEAALELSAHTVLTEDEALQFLRILQREQGQGD